VGRRGAGVLDVDADDDVAVVGERSRGALVGARHPRARLHLGLEEEVEEESLGRDVQVRLGRGGGGGGVGVVVGVRCGGGVRMWQWAVCGAGGQVSALGGT
jgi:hypothetical protein